MARFTRIQVVRKMAETGMVPVFFNKDPEICKQVISACYNGGVRVFEFTNRGDYAHEVFGEINKWGSIEYPDLILGIGSVIDAPTAALYIQLGANFVVSPLLNEDIASVVNLRKIAWSPGCGSVTEIAKAHSLGVEIVKIFPGSQVGGAKFVAAVKGPMPWTSIMPTGGVDPSEENLSEWFKAGVTCVGMGSKLLSSEIVTNKEFNKLEEKVRVAITTIKSLRQLHPIIV